MTLLAYVMSLRMPRLRRSLAGLSAIEPQKRRVPIFRITLQIRKGINCDLDYSSGRQSSGLYSAVKGGIALAASSRRKTS